MGRWSPCTPRASERCTARAARATSRASPSHTAHHQPDPDLPNKIVTLQLQSWSMKCKTRTSFLYFSLCKKYKIESNLSQIQIVSFLHRTVYGKLLYVTLISTLLMISVTYKLFFLNQSIFNRILKYFHGLSSLIELYIDMIKLLIIQFLLNYIYRCYSLKDQL